MMASLSYDVIFDSFMGNMVDPQIASLSQTEVNELMVEFLHKTMAQSYIRRLFSSVVLDDVTLTMSYELQTVVDADADKDFVVYILAHGMVVEWLQPQVNSKVNISQMIGGSKLKFYSQASHLTELKGLLADNKNEVRKAIRDRGYIYNSYLRDNK